MTCAKKCVEVPRRVPCPLLTMAMHASPTPATSLSLLLPAYEDEEDDASREGPAFGRMLPLPLPLSLSHSVFYYDQDVPVYHCIDGQANGYRKTPPPPLDTLSYLR